MKTVKLKKATDTRHVLNLKAGDWVEVRSRNEILATLDQHGRLDHLPFMPEMLQYCGRKLRVSKRADKTCDYTQVWSIRRLTNAVHLQGARCDGSGHDGCQAGCLIFWKEAWLKRSTIGNEFVSTTDLQKYQAPQPAGALCTVESLLFASQVQKGQAEAVFACQVTDVRKFTSYMSFWDPRQHIRDLRSGNLKDGLAGDSREHRLLQFVLDVTRIIQATVIGGFNEIQERRRGKRYPFIEGMAEKPSVERLNLQPGELVEIRSKEEIMASLDANQRNRGLWFDSEMLPYCGGIYRVLRRVNRIVDEKTGRMLNLKNPCIVLDGVVCKSNFHRLCPREIYPYWRENWLKRAADAPASVCSEDMVSSLQTIARIRSGCR